MDNRHFVCFDFETGGKDPSKCEIIQVGACVIDRNSLKIKDKFETLMKPEDFDALEDEALRVNGLTREQLADAPEASVMFPTWAAWIQKHNINKNKNSFGAPIPVYWGGDGFDMPIMNRYCEKYGYWDKKWNNQSLLNPIFTFDVMKHMWFWTRTMSDVKNVKLVTILEWMGVSKEEIAKGAHDGMWDATWTAKIAQRLLKVGAHMTSMNDEGKRRLEMKGCFANEFS
jgi:DNA polymerase III epsilon subunit-like protein